MSKPHVVAGLIPAAGLSLRMGEPKLTMRLAGASLIARVIVGLSSAGLDPIVVIAPPLEQDGAQELIDESQSAGASVLILPKPTPDMRTTVRWGLKAILALAKPDAIALCPGDCAVVAGELVRKLVECSELRPQWIVVPTHKGKRGHPLILPMRIAARIRRLKADQGINALLRLHSDRVIEVETDEPGTVADLDAPEEYQAWKERLGDRE